MDRTFAKSRETCDVTAGGGINHLGFVSVFPLTRQSYYPARAALTPEDAWTLIAGFLFC